MNHKLLLVDDSLDIGVFVQGLFANTDIHVRVTCSPTEGLALAESWLPDLVLLDVEMPEMDGFEFLRILQAQLRSHMPSVIFLTARVDAKTAAHGWNVGAMDYVTKPFDYVELVARVTNALHSKSVRAALASDPFKELKAGLRLTRSRVA